MAGRPVGPFWRLRRALRPPSGDRASTAIVSFMIGASVFLLATTVLINFVARPPGASMSNVVQADLESKGNNALATLLGTEGYPSRWSTSASGADGVQRLGLLQAGSTLRLDATKFDALARGSYLATSTTNGFVDYQEAKSALGLQGYDFHLRAAPVFDTFQTGAYGVDGLTDFRVGYVGHWSGATESSQSATERAKLAYLQSVSGGHLQYDDAFRIAVAGDAYKDDATTLKTLLVPLLGNAPASTILSHQQNANVFHVVNASVYRSALSLHLGAPLTNALALTDGSDDPTLATSGTQGASSFGYSQNREVRATLGTANLTANWAAVVSWNEWVDTNRDSTSIPLDDGAYGFVEASADGGSTWYPVTGNALYAKSQDSNAHPQLPPNDWTARTATIDNNTCAPCLNNPQVLVALHWVAGNSPDHPAQRTGWGWIVDDVTVAPTATTGFQKTFEKPTYDMLIVGSDVDATAFSSAEVKNAVRDYVSSNGGRLLVLGGESNTQWLDPLLKVGTSAGSGGVSTPDLSNPLLTVPNALDYATYNTNGQSWTFSATSYDDLFNAVVDDASGQPILLSSKAGTFAGPNETEGGVILTTYLPHSFPGDQALRFLANAITLSKYHYLTMDVGPPVPDGTAVQSVTRTATMDKTRDGSGAYVQMSLVFYVWQGAFTPSTVTTTGAPTPPVNLASSTTSGTVTLTWNAPASNGGSPITGYQAWRGTTSGAETLLATLGVVTTYADTAVSNGVTYYYNVTAINAQGSSATSNEASGTPSSTPGAPQGVAATGSVGAISVSWTQPASNGGAAITSYRVYRGTNSTNGQLVTTTTPGSCGNLGNVLSCVDAPITAGAAYWYNVTAVNLNGGGASSAAVQASAANVPDAPVLTATPGYRFISLAWTKPANGGDTIASYAIYRSTTPGTETLLANVTGENTLNYTDDTLGDGQTLYYRVAAHNGVDAGPMSAEASATTVSVPGAPSGVVVTATGVGTLKIEWLAPATGGVPDHYEIHASNTSNGEVFRYATTGATTLTWTETGLNPGLTRYYKVAAVNAAGNAMSSEGSGATWGYPGAPTFTLTPQSGHKVLIAIVPPVSNGGSAVTSYNIYACQSPCTSPYPASHGTTYNTALLTVTDTSPKNPLETWYYTVLAVNSVNTNTDYGNPAPVQSILTT